jgi:hypothetical protein
LQSSHWIARWFLLTPFSQVPHGNFTGPGFNDTSPDSKSNIIQISDSFFIDINEVSNAPNDSLPTSSTSGVNKLLFQDLREASRLHPKNFIAAYM